MNGKSYEDMTHREARRHLEEGGVFCLEGGYAARAVAGEEGVYVLVYRGEGVEAQAYLSLTHLANAMEAQGPLSEWRAEGEG